MPISLRLSAEIESEIVGFSARHGVSKSAVIVRSIQEFLARNAQPTSFQIYQEVMAEAGNQGEQKGIAKSDAKREAAELRPLKIQAREAIRQKHAVRSARASQIGSRTAVKAKAPKSPSTP